MKNWLRALIILAGASLILSSCSEEEEGGNLYTLGVNSFSASPDAAMLEIGRITDAFVAEFGAETFTMSGNKAKNDQDVIARFNKVAAAYTLSPGFTGFIIYDVFRGGKSLASHRFESHAFMYDLGWADISTTGVVPLAELASIEQVFHTQFNSDKDGEYIISGADEAACDAEVKKRFAEIGASITLSSKWTGYAVFSTERIENSKNIEVASYRFEQ